jgi:peptidoglycan/LPS O-acetylase OafA/YrhL
MHYDQIKQSSFDPRLSGLRGLASISVVFYHVPSIIAAFAGYGTQVASLWMGVPVFLMMSMYLLLRRLDDNPSLGHYFTRRIKRIWPIYYLVITSLFVLGNLAIRGLIPSEFSSLQISQTDFIRYLTFTEYWFTPNGGGIALAFWTLQLEEVVYIFIPLIHKASVRNKKIIAYGLIISTIVWLIGIWLITGEAQQFALWDQLRYMAPTWLAAYGFGIFAYLGFGKRKLRWSVPVIFVLTSAFQTYLPSVATFILLNHLIMYLLVLPGMMSVLVFPPSFLKYFLILGESSYALYAIHPAFLTIFGIAGIPLGIVSALAIESAIRPKQMFNRLRGYVKRPPFAFPRAQ